MGTWDIGFFDNDMACDWENEIKNNQNLDYIKDALQEVITSSDETLDIDVANRALAASESLARLAGTGSEHSSYTKHIDHWAAEFTDSIPKELFTLALETLDKILGIESELMQFWTIRGELLNWKDSIEKLQVRLKTAYEK